MTAEPASLPAGVVPPAAQTTAARPPVTDRLAAMRPERDELTRWAAARPADPRPRTVATQEIRFALAFTGGVSLAVWMGGVARELNLLVQASDHRRTPDQAPQPGTPDGNEVRRLYRRLLDLVDAEVAVDVLAGTSAGGINAALLGLANARRLDLAPLRDIWLTAGDFGKLMRDPAEPSPPSLLKGDGQMLTALDRGIAELIGDAEPTGTPLVTDVYITTTLLSPETSRFTDDYGTEIADTDHHGMFHFDADQLISDDVVPALALAARSSASFPGAFEPSFVPFGAPAGPAHPDMAPFSNATRAHWAADGGLLANRPIAPVLQTVFDRPADREVRRALLYVVPTAGAPSPGAEDRHGQPHGLAKALQLDAAAALNQSIAADLAAIAEHNDRIGAMSDAALRLAGLGNRLDGAWLTDAAAWKDYRERQGDWLARPLVAELTRQLSALGRDLPKEWAPRTGEDRDLRLRRLAREQLTGEWTFRWSTPDDAARAAAALGRPAYDSARATLLRLLRLGRTLATTLEDRNFLATCATYCNPPEAGPDGPATLVRRRLRAALDRRAATGEIPPLDDVVRQLAAEQAGGAGDRELLRTAWEALADTCAYAWDRLRRLVHDAPPPLSADELRQAQARAERLPLRERRAAAAAELRTYLVFLSGGDVVSRLLDLHVAVRSMLPVLTEVDQRIELTQVSADTRSLLAPHRATAASKLTGLQVHHFGAFYKPSWRANDWMWGRLDGCGWLVHLLLDPRRIVSVLENDRPFPGSAAHWFLTRLGAALETPVPKDLVDDLAFLDDETVPVPASLPRLSLWAASVLQRHIAAEELPVVAAQVAAGLPAKSATNRPWWKRIGGDAAERSDAGGYQGSPSPAAGAWLAAVHAVDWAKAGPTHIAGLLDGCPVGSERIEQEARDRTPLFIRTAAQAGAVLTAAGTGIGKTPASLRPTFATLRTITRTAYAVADRTHGVRRTMGYAAVVLLALGVLALLTDVTVLGITGLVLIGAALVVLPLAIRANVSTGLAIALSVIVALVAAAPWLPYLADRIFPWLRDVAVPAMTSHPWIWPVLVFLVLLPPAMTVAEFARQRRQASRAAGGVPAPGVEVPGGPAGGGGAPVPASGGPADVPRPRGSGNAVGPADGRPRLNGRPRTPVRPGRSRG